MKGPPVKEFQDEHLVFKRDPQPITLDGMRRFIDEVFIQKIILNLEVGESHSGDFRKITRTK